jgi:hypothetical protein
MIDWGSHMVVLMPLFQSKGWDHDSTIGELGFKLELQNNRGPTPLWRCQRLHSEAQFVNVTMAFVAFPDFVLCVVLLLLLHGVMDSGTGTDYTTWGFWGSSRVKTLFLTYRKIACVDG